MLAQISSPSGSKNGGHILQILFVLFLAISLAYLNQIFRITQVVGILAISFLLIISILRSRAFIFLIFALKPFIDLLWQVRYFNLGGKDINPLNIIGLFVFVVVGCLYFSHADKNKIFNGKLIWVFLTFNIFSSLISVLIYRGSILVSIDSLLRIFDAYFIYFISHFFLEKDKDIMRMIEIFWISTLFVGLLSIVLYLKGQYNIDISQQAVRFAGLYNDPGTPSYNAIMSIIFGTLYLELYRKTNKLNLSIIFLMVFTILVSAFIIIITVTKSALIMLVVFLIMWIGSFKKKMYLLIPFMIMGGCYYYLDDNIQKRLAPEILLLKEGQITLEAVRPLGTGRVGYWEKILNYYIKDYSWYKKITGNYSTNFSPHNQYIAYLMQIGLLGLFIFLAIIFRFYKKLILMFKKYKKPELYMAIVLLTIFTVYGITGHPFNYTTHLWYLMMLLGLINVNRKCH